MEIPEVEVVEIHPNPLGLSERPVEPMPTEEPIETLDELEAMAGLSESESQGARVGYLLGCNVQFINDPTCKC